MTIQKIIFLVGQYYTERDQVRFGIELLQENGFEVSVWDLSRFIYPETIDSLKETFGIFEKENIIRFDSVKKVVDAIGKENQETFFMSTIYYTSRTMNIFKAISQVGCKYGCTGPYTILGFSHRRDNIVPFKNTSQKIFDKKIFRKIFRKIENRIHKKYLTISSSLFGINCANYFALAGGKLTTAIGPIINNNTYIQHIHAADYDSFLKHKNVNERKSDNDFIVFIDQYLPYHPDMLISKHTDKIDSEQYYEDLKTIFDHIESLTHDKVVIAAHPKANYKGKEYLFGGRKIVYGHNSMGLISKSNLVLMHYSTAINLAVLFRKPILFITSNMLNESIFGSYINALANWFKVSPVNISDINKKIELPAVDSEMYDAYISDFIKNPLTKDILFWQQVADHIKEYK
jgi:hypothetical protein